MKEAKAAKVHARRRRQGLDGDRQGQRTAKTTSADANAKAKATGTEAREDAAAEKRDADYAVAKEKCDVLAGAAKDICVNDAKARFGKP